MFNLVTQAMSLGSSAFSVAKAVTGSSVQEIDGLEPLATVTRLALLALFPQCLISFTLRYAIDLDWPRVTQGIERTYYGEGREQLPFLLPAIYTACALFGDREDLKDIFAAAIIGLNNLHKDHYSKKKEEPNTQGDIVPKYLLIRSYKDCNQTGACLDHMKKVLAEVVESPPINVAPLIPAQGKKEVNTKPADKSAKKDVNAQSIQDQESISNNSNAAKKKHLSSSSSNSHNTLDKTKTLREQALAIKDAIPASYMYNHVEKLRQIWSDASIKNLASAFNELCNDEENLNRRNILESILKTTDEVFKKILLDLAAQSKLHSS